MPVKLPKLSKALEFIFNTAMANIESLKGFFYFFEVCGIHHFSTNDLIKKKSSQWRKFFHAAYSVLLFFFLIVLIEFYKTFYPKNVMTKNKFMIFVMKAALRFGFLLIVTVGVVESYLKKEKFKRIFKLSQKLSMIYASKSNVQCNFISLRNSFFMKFMVFILMFTLKEISKGLAVQSYNIPTIGLLFGILPVFYMYATVLAFNFYVELINFELVNFLSLILIVSKSERQSKLFLKSSFDSINISLVCRLYQIIHEMSRLVNNILRYTILILWSVFVISIINNIYSHLIEATLNNSPANTFEVKFCKQFLFIWNHS